jgi:hypothetical protein
LIFDSIKILKTANKTGLLVEELFVLQTIYDYQVSIKELNQTLKNEIETNYIQYFQNSKTLKGIDEEVKIPWKKIIDRLIRDGWIEDHRKNKNTFSLNEVSIGTKFDNILELEFNDEELFEITKTLYPKFYVNEYQKLGKNFNYNAKEEEAAFDSFKKMLKGNKRENWFEFKFITESLFEKDSDGEFATPSALRFDRYINTFKNNLSEYKKLI